MLARLPVKGVKIHQLMIIKGTPLEKMYLSGDIEEISIERYAALLRKFLSRLRPGQHIHRIAADSKPEAGLIAPLWSANKLESLKHILENF
jgi:radical SAM superfamily enzyme